MNYDYDNLFEASELISDAHYSFIANYLEKENELVQKQIEHFKKVRIFQSLKQEGNEQAKR
jgi:hypothetical protein